MRFLLLPLLFFSILSGSEKTALVTGITGQDGSYLAELLLSKGYVVHGIIRRSSTSHTENINHLLSKPELKDRLFIHYADLSDSNSILSVLETARPDEIYNLGAQSDVRISFDLPVQTGDISGLGVARILQLNRQLAKPAKVYQASTSEQFGSIPPPQSENTPFHPRSPYGVAKLYGFWIGVNYRESYGMFVSNGILFNHESARRGENFITRKITKSLASILTERQSALELGNLDAKRDWGFAPDYVECMWRILQQNEPGDYVIGTGRQHTVREFVEKAFRYAGIELTWQGEGVNEIGIIGTVSDRWKSLKKGQILIKVNPYFYRPAEVASLMADSSKAYQKLQWQPNIDLDQLVQIMVDADFERAGLEPIGSGIRILREQYPHIEKY